MSLISSNPCNPLSLFAAANVVADTARPHTVWCRKFRRDRKSIPQRFSVNPSTFGVKKDQSTRVRQNKDTADVVVIQGLLVNQDTHCPEGGPVLLGIALP